MCKNWELTYSPSRRYPSYFFNIQTIGITDLSKSINIIKKDEKEKAHSKESILSVLKKKYCTWKNPRHSFVNPKRYLKSELIKEEKINKTFNFPPWERHKNKENEIRGFASTILQIRIGKNAKQNDHLLSSLWSSLQASELCSGAELNSVWKSSTEKNATTLFTNH